VKAIVLDGVVTQSLADSAADSGLKYLVGARERVKNKPNEVEIMTPEDLQ